MVKASVLAVFVVVLVLVLKPVNAGASSFGTSRSGETQECQSSSMPAIGGSLIQSRRVHTPSRDTPHLLEDSAASSREVHEHTYAQNTTDARNISNRGESSKVDLSARALANTTNKSSAESSLDNTSGSEVPSGHLLDNSSLSGIIRIPLMSELSINGSSPISDVHPLGTANSFPSDGSLMSPSSEMSLPLTDGNSSSSAKEPLVLDIQGVAVQEQTNSSPSRTGQEVAVQEQTNSSGSRTGQEVAVQEQTNSSGNATEEWHKDKSKNSSPKSEKESKQSKSEQDEPKQSKLLHKGSDDEETKTEPKKHLSKALQELDTSEEIKNEQKAGKADLWFIFILTAMMCMKIFNVVPGAG